MSRGSLSEIVEDYRSRHRDRNAGERRWFAIQKTFRDAIQRAGMAERPDGKRFSHQRRLSKHTLQRATAVLLSAESELAGSKTFAQLHERVRELIGDIDGVGELMVYDTTVRLAAKLGLEADRVYLHAGTRVGARALGFTGREESLELSRLPKELRRLPADQVEDILCIYKRNLGRIGVPLANGAC